MKPGKPLARFSFLGCTSLRALVQGFSKQIELREEERAPGNTSVPVRFK